MGVWASWPRCAPWSPAPPPPLSNLIRAMMATADHGGSKVALGPSAAPPPPGSSPPGSSPALADGGGHSDRTRDSPGCFARTRTPDTPLVGLWFYVVTPTTHPPAHPSPSPSPIDSRAAPSKAGVRSAARHRITSEVSTRVVARTTAQRLLRRGRQAVSTLWQMPMASWREIGCHLPLCLLEAAHPGLRDQEGGAEGQSEDDLDVPLAAVRAARPSGPARTFQPAGPRRSCSSCWAPDLARHQNGLVPPILL